MTDIYLQSPAGEKIPVPFGEATLGRESSNQMVVNDPAVSRRHLRFKREADQVWLTDLSSANGTLINDHRLAADQMYPLSNGDRISLGGRVTYTIHGASPAANASDIAGTMLLSDAPVQPPAAYPVPQPAYPAYSPPVRSGAKPGKVQTLATMNLVDGILNLLWGIGLTCGAITSIIGIILLPIAVYPIILGILELIYASQLMSDPPRVTKPAQYLAVMQLINIITGDVISVIIGIISLIYNSDAEVRDYFDTLETV